MSATSPGPSFLLPRHFPVVVRSPHNPPYKQLLVGMGAVLPPPFAHTRCRSKPHLSSTLQAVARRCGGGCRGARHHRHHPSPLLALLLFYPRPTPRAVAREAGGGWCGVVHRPPPLLLLPVIVAAIPTAIHPTSSRSWGWGWLVCCPSCGAGAGVVLLRLLVDSIVFRV
jgi:hypothetical protein